MNLHHHQQRRAPLTLVSLIIACLLCTQAHAQSDQSADFTQEQLEQILAPIALYPDDLVSQIFMASTYPLEIVEADRWVKANPKVTGDKLSDALNDQTWDASVKSLVNFPDVLDMMSQKLDWTTNLGDAFVADQKKVMDTVQSLRAKAKANGNLEDTDQQNVVVQKDSGTQVIVIESTSPDVVYVPVYNPSTVYYSTWPYPSYPPYYYYPPAYTPRPGLWFGAGFACGAAWGYAWGNCNWGRNDIDINVKRNNNFNRNINTGGRKNGNWKHDSSHRKGVAYRDHATSQRFSKGANNDVRRARESYRGRADAGRRDLNRDGAGGRANQRDRAGNNANRANQRSRTGSARNNQSRTPSRGNNAQRSRSRNSNAFSGSHHSSQRTRHASNRGSRSRGHSRGGGGHRGGGGRRR